MILRAVGATTLALIAALGLSACGDDGSSSSGTSDGANGAAFAQCASHLEQAGDLDGLPRRFAQQFIDDVCGSSKGRAEAATHDVRVQKAQAAKDRADEEVRQAAAQLAAALHVPGYVAKPCIDRAPELSTEEFKDCLGAP